jgi:hypothetical protein
MSAAAAVVVIAVLVVLVLVVSGQESQVTGHNMRASSELAQYGSRPLQYCGSLDPAQ